jgi:hypothetical protein
LPVSSEFLAGVALEAGVGCAVLISGDPLDREAIGFERAGLR